MEIYESDMRDFHCEDKADLVISELLGGFGDNELSPECLDGATHLMKGNEPISSKVFLTHPPRFQLPFKGQPTWLLLLLTTLSI